MKQLVFFQNISSFNISYFTISPQNPEHFLNWDWINRQKELEFLKYVGHLRLNKPLNVKINGRENSGIIKF